MKKIFFSFVILSLIATAGFGCKTQSEAEKEATKPVTLNFWGVFDESDAIQPLITAYRAKHPNVTINYKMYRFDEYEDELLNALAEDRGPDIFMVHNHWMRGYLAKILPLPAELTIAYVTQSGGALGSETKATLAKEKTMTLRALQDSFVQVVADDAVAPVWNATDEVNENKIVGLPLSVDTLALYYNRDILNAAGIAEPPTTWTDFLEQVKTITKLNADGGIAQSAAAIGTSSNIERFSDIVSALMMQNGTEMTNESGFATFNKIPKALTGRSEPPGFGAVRFYTDFANSGKEVYTWNDDFPNSLDAFSTGQTAFFFGYSYHLSQIRTKAPKLNLGIARLPQLEGNPEVNYANYWLNSVSAKSKSSNYAWDFVQFAASEANVKAYLDAAKRPTALRSLRDSQLEDVDLSVFASQLLTAKDWYRGKNWAAVEQTFADMIDSQVYGTMELKDAINLAVSKVNQTIQ
ncbi:MAG: extracellular solute-binding protein [Patescibacteria group bacterium]|nr:extracellular solute-binding protein [Patescibacteria group bacterium]